MLGLSDYADTGSHLSPTSAVVCHWPQGTVTLMLEECTEPSRREKHKIKKNPAD